MAIRATGVKYCSVFYVFIHIFLHGTTYFYMVFLKEIKRYLIANPIQKRGYFERVSLFNFCEIGLM